jgi:hypothetical protein
VRVPCSGKQMNLPNGNAATVDERKVRDYLLSTSHPVGRFKARFFDSLGFVAENWQDLARAILELATQGDAQLVQDNELGSKYLVAGALTGPQGRSVDVVSVWIIRTGSDTPRLVTVYPK